MIDYTEKGGDLHDRINAAGHWLEQNCDAKGALTWRASDDKAVQAIIDAYTVADAVAHKVHEVARLAKDVQDRFVEKLGYSVGEMSTWPIKSAELVAYAKTGMEADAPRLVAEAQLSGRPLANVVQRVQANAAAYAAFADAAAAARGKHTDALRSQTTFDGVAGYNIATGWPEA